MDESNFICPITCNIFDDPVMAEDNQMYERSAIEEWFIRNEKSPVTNCVIGKKLVKVYLFNKILDDYKNNTINFTKQIDVADDKEFDENKFYELKSIVEMVNYIDKYETIKLSKLMAGDKKHQNFKKLFNNRTNINLLLDRHDTNEILIYVLFYSPIHIFKEYYEEYDDIYITEEIFSNSKMIYQLGEKLIVFSIYRALGMGIIEQIFKQQNYDALDIIMDELFYECKRHSYWFEKVINNMSKYLNIQYIKKMIWRNNYILMRVEYIIDNLLKRLPLNHIKLLINQFKDEYSINIVSDNEFPFLLLIELIISNNIKLITLTNN